MSPTYEYRPECHHTLPDDEGKCFACGDPVPEGYKPPVVVPYSIEFSDTSECAESHDLVREYIYPDTPRRHFLERGPRYLCGISCARCGFRPLIDIVKALDPDDTEYDRLLASAREP